MNAQSRECTWMTKELKKFSAGNVYVRLPAMYKFMCQENRLPDRKREVFLGKAGFPKNDRSCLVGNLPEKPTCQQQPVLGDPLNRLEQVVLEGQISTAWAHLKGKGIQSKHTHFPKKQGTQIQVLRKPNFKQPATLGFVEKLPSGTAPMLSGNQNHSPWSLHPLVDTSLKSLTHWEIHSPLAEDGGWRLQSELQANQRQQLPLRKASTNVFMNTHQPNNQEGNAWPPK